jgi:hypothetical protein
MTESKNTVEEVSDLMTELEGYMSMKSTLDEMKSMGFRNIPAENEASIGISETASRIGDLIEKAYNNGVPTAEWNNVQDLICNNGNKNAQDKVFPIILVMKAKARDFNNLEPLIKGILSMSVDSESINMLDSLCQSYPETLSVLESVCSKTNSMRALCNAAEIYGMNVDFLAKRMLETPIMDADDMADFQSFGLLHASELKPEIRQALKGKFNETTFQSNSQPTMQDDGRQGM